MLSFTSRGRCRLGKGLREEKLSSKLPWLVHFLYFLFSVCSGAKPAIRGTEELVSSNTYHPFRSFFLTFVQFEYLAISYCYCTFDCQGQRRVKKMIGSDKETPLATRSSDSKEQ